MGNGLVLVSERFWAAAIREPGGGIQVASGRKPRLPGSGGWNEGAVSRPGRAGESHGVSPAGGHVGGAGARRASTGLGKEGVPLLRGLSRFGESLLVLALVKMRLPGAQLPLDAARVMKALAGSAAATSAVRRWAPKSALVQEAGAALAAFVPAVLSLKNSRITAYHGAEHKVIGGLEAGASGGAAGAAKEHDRCGTNLVGPLLAATVACNLLLRGRGRHGGARTPAASALAGAVSLGLALEALRWATRHGDTLAARLLLAPGRAVQKVFTTAEPSPEELEVAERALAELLRLERIGL